jgi:hypothetical protein
MATGGHAAPCGACKRGFTGDDPGHHVQHVTAPEGGYSKDDADQAKMAELGWPYGGITVCVECYAKINPNARKLAHAATAGVK